MHPEPFVAATEPGRSYRQLVGEKGMPLGRIERGDRVILSFNDQIVTLRGDTVVDFARERLVLV